MRAFNIAAALSALSMPALGPLHPAGKHHQGSTRYPTGHKPNRSVYRPHHGEREIARRLRHQARDEQRQRERGAPDFAVRVFGAEFASGLSGGARVSRRGRVITTKQGEA
jgi:hypothetical protein